MVRRPRLRLDSVTLVAIDGVAHHLTAFALSETLYRIHPYHTIIFTDQFEPFHSLILSLPRGEISVHPVFDLAGIEKVENIMWRTVPRIVTTEHVLFIQYDGFVLDQDVFRGTWLTYDYIGARWPWHRDNRIGNGGFSLRSRRLLQYLNDHQKDFPVGTPEDDVLCRQYRGYLESRGFQWAPETVAIEFSVEREPDPPCRTFGFHGIFNVPRVLDTQEASRWARLAPSYVRNKPEWKEIEPWAVQSGII